MYTGTWQENTYVVTGSSGSGKSSVCKILVDLGAKIVNADDLAKIALSPSSEGLRKVRLAFGDEAFNGEELDRKALANLVFSNSSMRAKLEAITHPIIGELANEAFAELSKAGASVLVYDCPLFFETKLREQKFKGIILVTAKKDTKIARLVARDNISRKLAEKRLLNQLSDEEKIPLSTIVIENNGDLYQLEQRVKEVFEGMRVTR